MCEEERRQVCWGGRREREEREKWGAIPFHILQSVYSGCEVELSVILRGLFQCCSHPTPSLSTLQKAAPKTRKSASSVAVSSDSSSEKSGSEAGKKRESARLKLREMKEAAKRAKSSRGEGADMEDVMVMFPGMKVADSKEGDVFKAPPSVSLSANGGTAGTMQAKTPLQAGQQKARTRGSSLRRSTRQSKTIDPAEVGCLEGQLTALKQVILSLHMYILSRYHGNSKCVLFYRDFFMKL